MPERHATQLGGEITDLDDTLYHHKFVTTAGVAYCGYSPLEGDGNGCGESWPCAAVRGVGK